MKAAAWIMNLRLKAEYGLLDTTRNRHNQTQLDRNGYNQTQPDKKTQPDKTGQNQTQLDIIRQN